MFRYCLIIILSSIAINPLLGQCHLDGADEYGLCNKNFGVTLGVSNKNAFSYDWGPSEGLSSTSIRNPIAKPGLSQTYTVTAKIFIGKNLVVNGNFDKGNAHFTSKYSFLPNPDASSSNFSEGKYIIDNTPENRHPCFPNCVDIPTGRGKMMIVNGASTANVVVWEQTIAVEPDKDYAFTAFAQNVSCGGNFPAILQFSINDSLIGEPFEVSSELCKWNQFNEVWNSRKNTSAKISIVNQATWVSGNDFALDSISFREYCEATKMVKVKLLTDYVVKNIETCTGDSILINNTYVKTKGQFIHTYKNRKGCDSTVTINLSFKPPLRTYPYVALCKGDSLLLEKKYRKISGKYTDTFKTHLGCDSIVRTFIQFVPKKHINIEASPCFNTAFIYRNKRYDKKGIYYDTAYYNQCIDTVITIKITPHPERKLEMPEQQFCKGDSLPYKNAYVLNDTIISDSLFATTGCDSIVVYSYKTFNNHFSIEDTAFFCEESEAEFDAGDGYINYLWSNGSNKQILKTFNENSYTITVIDSNNCVMHDTVYAIERCQPIFFVPNAFTINGDGLNDYFSIYTKNVTALKFTIVDRWGEVLFETDKVDFIWDGTYKNQALPEGVYQWMGSFEGYSFDGKILTENKKGFIQILR